ncbi:MAG: beta-ketoacyl-[acyl-carrier-protein] synthase family protein [Phycisphaerae bacterium]|nr:beta-ketoacyl-[acyl-carrier-protein] synthase family protein [Phycisphaerae bacterium]
MAADRVVVSGFGAVTPLGLTAEKTWQGLCAGQCGINTIKAFDPTGFDCKLAGEVPEFKIRDYIPKSVRKAAKLMSRDIELSIIASLEAIKSAGLITKGIDESAVNIDSTRIAINFAAGLISCDLLEIAPAVAQSLNGDGSFDMHKWGKQGIEFVTPLWLLKYLPNMLACHVGIIHDIQGPSNTITCAEAGSHIAIIEASQQIQRGSADIALAGGAEGKVNPIIMIRQNLLKRSSVKYNDKPDQACRPFDKDACGCVFGEGAAVLVLESLQNAQKRCAKIYAEIVGTGQSNNINSKYENLEADGQGIRIAIEKALSAAKITPDQLDLVIPHGTGIPQDDAAESKALEMVLKDAVKNVPVWSTKSMLSNTGAASGNVDIAAALCAMRDNLIPAAKNCPQKADWCNLNIPQQTIKKDVRNVLVCSYTYGGQTAAIVLKKLDSIPVIPNECEESA